MQYDAINNESGASFTETWNFQKLMSNKNFSVYNNV